MAQEIERKFMVRGDGWRGAGSGFMIRQGYLSLDLTMDGRGYLTVKRAHGGCGARRVRV
jgi:adenylate cyclase